MQTNLSPDIKDTPEGREADGILRTCVHCGFCNATCPTYQLLGDELDGPRGRIYLIKQLLEGQTVSRHTQQHLDRCLTCRNCETTCPSGVAYGRLLEIGRDAVEDRVRRPWGERLLRRTLRVVLPYSNRVRPLVAAGRLLRPVLPRSVKQMLPKGAPPEPHTGTHRRAMLRFEGCVQPVLAPEINAGAARVFDRLGIGLVSAKGAGCCGAISLHLGQTDEARRFMRRNIDAWWPHIESGAEAIVTTASGCGVTLKDYGHLLSDDPRYAEKARHIAERVFDISEVLEGEDIQRLSPRDPTLRRIAFQAPCTLQHGMGLQGRTERLLKNLGFELTPVADAHLCCGSAGTYSILQRKLSDALARNKVSALEAGEPQAIATANIGCLLEMRKRSELPVVHWIELLR